ncbi:hypothetical protein CYV19_05150 [Natronobacterium gregoryi SP2]|uniref:Uncharacterized protein n=1 Tax=Natronobacterium gregoryi (strain ATCC 43098 / DSM 3393 / CCM 3738 / CIP 104747 / IAM 13177 / JCM 8860 / NBRC 102187 / NCIMB 2189 / SP2) TaxID=797304 RepID=L9Y244_NATGS|nr:hypothetical protein C490_11898 [Natronobacterium gregoryi SP2]PLK21207.1 hypothetical protein CYV19_05150 [Natronobacterium gregoryi SP2]
MTRDDRPRTESPWFCPECEIWVGWKHDECSERHHRPRLPLRYDDVEFDHSWQVTFRHRLRGKLRSLFNRVNGGIGR